MASTASASLLDFAEENEWADEDVPYEEDDEDDLALLFENASVAEVDTYEELTAALNNVRNGGTIQLTANIATVAMLEITRGSILTIDLNGYTLDRGRESADADGHVILVDNGGSLTHQRENGVPSGSRFVLPFVFATITTYA
jgi:hypothetical protein